MCLSFCPLPLRLPFPLSISILLLSGGWLPACATHSEGQPCRCVKGSIALDSVKVLHTYDTDHPLARSLAHAFTHSCVHSGAATAASKCSNPTGSPRAIWSLTHGCVLRPTSPTFDSCLHICGPTSPSVSTTVPIILNRLCERLCQ